MEGLDMGAADRFKNASPTKHGSFMRDDLTVVAFVVR
jgi:hypothetical protein